MTTPRLFVEGALSAGGDVTLAPDQTHYLRTVLRLEPGAVLRVFNGRDGEWDGRIEALGKRAGTVTLTSQRRAQTCGPDVHLLFAPLKKTRTDFLVEKATELGAGTVRPVFTRRTNSERVNSVRLAALAREAAEQTERLDVPKIHDPQPLAQVIGAWSDKEPGRRILFADEGAPRDTGWTAPNAGAPDLATFLSHTAKEPGAQSWAILVGPEGGFAPEERTQLREASFAYPVSLGPRILRAETAVVAALAVFQAVAGDWTPPGGHAP